jgi:hypothetical protein
MKPRDIKTKAPITKIKKNKLKEPFPNNPKII